MIIGVYPMKEKKISEGGPTVYRSLSIKPFRELKQKSFVIEKDFHTWQKKNACVRESVRTRGMGWACDIHVE